MSLNTEWVKTRKCGCGGCRFAPISTVCALEMSPTAIWLWGTKFKDEEEITEEESKTFFVEKELQRAAELKQARKDALAAAYEEVGMEPDDDEGMTPITVIG